MSWCKNRPDVIFLWWLLYPWLTALLPLFASINLPVSHTRAWSLPPPPSDEQAEVYRHDFQIIYLTSVKHLQIRRTGPYTTFMIITHCSWFTSVNATGSFCVSNSVTVDWQGHQSEKSRSEDLRTCLPSWQMLSLFESILTNVFRLPTEMKENKKFWCSRGHLARKMLNLWFQLQLLYLMLTLNKIL